MTSWSQDLCTLQVGNLKHQQHGIKCTKIQIYSKEITKKSKHDEHSEDKESKNIHRNS